MRAPIVHKKHCHKDSAFLVNQAGSPLGGPYELRATSHESRATNPPSLSVLPGPGRRSLRHWDGRRRRRGCGQSAVWH